MLRSQLARQAENGLSAATCHGAYMKLASYCALRDAAAEAAQLQKIRKQELYAALETLDLELAEDGLDLLGGAREAIAHYLVKSISSMGGATCYELLATGKRALVVELFRARCEHVEKCPHPRSC